MPERQLGPYRLVKQLAVGGMAEIYSAKAAGVGGFEKLVAIKIIHPNYSEDPEFVQMLVDEAKLAVHLQHGNIVQTFDLGKIDDQYYIAMELIDGVDLYKLLRRSSEKEIEFPFEVAAFIAEEAAHGLDYAHRKRDERGRPLEIVHRDISPQNILVSHDGEVKIVDFGIAKAARRKKQTAAGVIKGKYYYMSPEQAWGDPIDHRTDIFSTGILLYEMLVGQMLYLEEDMDVLLEKVRKAIIAKPSTKRKDVPLQLETIVMKALAKRPEDRYPSAGELATALGRFVRARAPDFTRGKLAAWVSQIIGNDPTDQNKLARDPKLSTAVRRAEIERDQNSLLFKIEDLIQKKPEVKTDPDPLLKRPVNAPRRSKDQATSPVKMPELAARSFGGDYEENEATIVDGTGETLMALKAEEHSDEESTRPMGPKQLRNAISGIQKLEDDPAVDTEFDDEERVESGQILAGDSLADDPGTDRTSIEVGRKRPAASARPAAPAPRLPGVRNQPSTAPGLYDDDSGPLGGDTPQDDEDETRDGEDTNERLKPTLEMRPQAITSPDEEETAVSAPKNAPAPKSASAPAGGVIANPQPTAPTAPWPPPNQPLSSLPPPSMVPLPAGLPVLSATGSQPISLQANPSSSGRYMNTDAVVKSLQPGRSRLVLVIVGAALLAAAVVAMFASGPSTPARGTIEVVSSPAGATVSIDGTPIQQPTPLVITDVDPARPHKVIVHKDGAYDPWESEVKFEGETRQVRLQAILVPIVATLDISSTPSGAEVIVNGRIAGTTPATVGDLSPTDEVVVEVRLRGYRVARRTVSLDGKRRLDLAIPLEKAR